MIKLKDAEIIDLLPVSLKYDINTICLSYAIKQETERICRLADGARPAVAIDELDESILDELAVELNTMYYDQDANVESKRKLIKNTMPWHMKQGTTASVVELVESVYGNGEIEEWFDFGGAPYTFKIRTDESGSGAKQKLVELIDKVKNIRSHLESVENSKVATLKFIASAFHSQIFHPTSIRMTNLNENYSVTAKTKVGMPGRSVVYMPQIRQHFSKEYYSESVTPQSIINGITIQKNQAIKEV